MIILSGNCPRHHNAIMLELTDFDDSRISYLARISRGHHVDTLLVPREYKDTFESTELYEVLLPNISIGGVQFARRDDSGWRPYDTGTFISYASNGITLSDEGTCK